MSNEEKVSTEEVINNIRETLLEVAPEKELTLKEILSIPEVEEYILNCENDSIISLYHFLKKMKEDEDFKPVETSTTTEAEEISDVVYLDDTIKEDDEQDDEEDIID
tara:strand:+ start:6319 stop:6639 length:321 start_codon:yes stop_codon:yes gene_type:complete